MNITAKLFQIIFQIPFFRKRYYGFYKRIFKPFGLFEGQSALTRFDKTMKMKVDLEEWIQQQIYFLGTWDEQGIKFLKNHLKSGDVFFDIGANIGCYSLVASKLVGSEGKVHSFEPVSEVYNRLLFNIELNQLKNITVNRKAVFETSETLEFFVSSKENKGMSSIFHHDTESGEIQKVEAITIDEYIEKTDIQRIDMIKIDIEGAELFALKGMKTTLRKFKPVIIMELSDNVLQNSPVEKKEILNLMKELNYEIKGISKQGFLVDISEASTGYTNFAFCKIND